MRIISSHPLSGGCINSALKINANCGPFFVKWNDNAVAQMFQKEAKGLQLLRNTNTIRLPKTINASNHFLLLEYIESTNKSTIFWESFGRGLAALHQNTAATFGLDHDNYIGSLPQCNTPMNSWTEFFIHNRLVAQLNIGDCAAEIRKKFDALFSKLPSLLPAESPALIHGDLWSGNVLCTHDKVVLIDPAVYYGHREMDLAMTALFGGVPKRFYDAYNEYYPLEKGWGKRTDLCNVYPLLVHHNLFGGNYLNQVNAIINSYI